MLDYDRAITVESHVEWLWRVKLLTTDPVLTLKSAFQSANPASAITHSTPLPCDICDGEECSSLDRVSRHTAQARISTPGLNKYLQPLFFTC